MDVKLVKATQAIQCSNYSLDTVQKLRKSGFDCAQLSGTTVCGLVAHNFGLGLQLLLSSGVKLDCVDPVSGNSPLILLAAEGLCGPVRNLINHVPVDHLLLVNRSSNSVLSLLLARGHGCCGCLEILLRRLSSSSLLHPTQPCNRIILKTADLLEQIKTSSIDRVVGVVNLWISVNFIDLEDVVTVLFKLSDSHRALVRRGFGSTALIRSLSLNIPHGSVSNERYIEEVQEVSQLFLKRTIGIVVRDCLSGWTSPHIIRTSMHVCFQLLSKILVLGRLSVRFLEDCQQEIDSAFSIDRQKPLEQLQIQQLRQLHDGINKLQSVFKPITPLKLLTILSIRRQLQRAMRSGCGPLVAGAREDFVFHYQVKELNLPDYLNRMIILQDDIHVC